MLQYIANTYSMKALLVLAIVALLSLETIAQKIEKNEEKEATTSVVAGGNGRKESGDQTGSSSKSDSQNEGDSTSEESLNSRVDKMEAKLQSVLEKEGNTVIGRIKLKTGPIESYSGGRVVAKLTIDSVLIGIKDGLIREIRVLSGDKMFYNKRAPISLLRYSSRNDVLANDLGTECIFLKDFLLYIPEVGNNYVPDDSKKITLTAKENTKTLYAQNSLNSLVDYRIYSDFFGLINKESNGLAQFEAKAKIFLNTINFPNWDIIAVNNLSPFFNLAKFDTSNGSVVLINTDTTAQTYTVSAPLEFLQKAYLNVGGALELIQLGQNRRYISTNIPAGININLTSVSLIDRSDPDMPDTTKVDYSSFTTFIGANLVARRLDNFGMTLGVFALYTRPMGNSAIEPFDPFWGLKTSGELFFYTDDDQDKSIFLRFNYVNDLDVSLTSDFYQLQIGYKAPLSFNREQ